MRSILNMKCRACDVMNMINTYGKNSSSKKRKIGYSGYQLKNGNECTSQFFEKNVIKLRKGHVFIFNSLLFLAKSISRDAALPSLTVG